MRAPTDIAGSRFGRLVALRLDPAAKPGRARWICQCDCGAQKSIFGTTLRLGTTASCGCLRREIMAGANRSHGGSKSPEYGSWEAMRRRCFDTGHHNYPRYGGRGIGIHPSWRESFDQFLADMGPRPAGMTLDRIDNDGDYGPSNCRWATHAEQAANRSTNPRTKLTYELAEEIRSLHRDGWLQRELAERYGVCRSRISDVLTGKSWKAGI